jgi:hypothetical protein
MPTEMDFDQAMRIRGVAELVSGETSTGTLSGDFTITHQADDPPADRQMGVLYEFRTIKTLKFELGDDTITVGKQALFFRGRFIRIEDVESELEPLGDYIGVLVEGDLEPGRVMMRALPEADGNVA